MTPTMVATISPRERELRGHDTRRLRLPMCQDFTLKLCECGCGQPAPLALRTRPTLGWVKGEPLRFRRGHSMKGRKHSAEAKAKIAEASRGHTLSAESRAKISAAKKGIPHTAEARAKMSAAHRGRTFPKGAEAPQWKGGRHVDGARVFLHVGTDHPMASATGYVLEHRLLMAHAINRHLRPAEHIHHIDQDRMNNSLDNLVIVSRSQHTRIHNLIRRGVEQTQAVREVLG